MFSLFMEDDVDGVRMRMEEEVPWSFLTHLYKKRENTCSHQSLLIMKTYDNTNIEVYKKKR